MSCRNKVFKKYLNEKKNTALFLPKENNLRNNNDVVIAGNRDTK